MPNYRKICPECGEYMQKHKHANGLWYYECPKCGFTRFAFGTYFKIISLLIITISIILGFYYL